MKIITRLKKLEQKLTPKKSWAVFTMGYYEDEHLKEAAKERLLEEYFSKFQSRPTHCIFINETPGCSLKQSGKFLYAF